MTDSKNDLEAKLENFLEDLQVPNILLVGRTGVGKSTLINSVFGKKMAVAGAGVPITQDFKKYVLPKAEGIPITLYDSAGFETGKEQEFLDGVFEFISSQKEKGKEEQIHLVWYVVNASSARFEYFEKDLVNKLSQERVPSIIVLSQCDRAGDDEIHAILAVIKQFNFERAYGIVEVAAAPLLKRGKPTCEPFGLEELVQKTAELLPKAYVDAFIAAQVVNIKVKRRLAWTYIAASAALCFGAGYIPIPFTTPLATWLTQKELCFRLATLFGYQDLNGLPELLEKTRSSREGRLTFWATAISDLFVGEPLTSTLAGGTAATFNCVVGLALASTFEEVAKRELEGLSHEEIERLLQQLFQENFDNYRRAVRIKRKEDIEKFKNMYLEDN